MAARLYLALVVAALIGATSATCRNVVCHSLSEFEADACTPCEKAFKVSNEDPENGVCCKVFACKQDPEQPCCGRTCAIDTEDEATASCNVFSGNSILDMLNPAFGTITGDLVRPAKPDAGKCCNKYRCSQDAAALCANTVAKQPCQTNCPSFYDTIIEMPADPTVGRCCPVISCNFNAAAACAGRTNNDCPVPTCDPLEDLIIVEEPRPSSLDCCTQYRCVPNAERVCAAKVELDPLGPNNQPCAACELTVIVRPARPSDGVCYPETQCVPDPSNQCCGFDFDSCAAEPNCGPFADSVIVQPADLSQGRCCDRFACVDNYTRICESFQCRHIDAADYQADNCPNPTNRNWYFVEIKRPADIASGRCCPTYKCRETIEKKLYDAESSLRRRRRRRRS